MSTLSTSSASRFWQACRHPAVWARAAKLGLVVGLIQVSLNQGDHWLQGQVTTGVVIKSILSPLLSFGIAFASATATHVENLKRQGPCLAQRTPRAQRTEKILRGLPDPGATK